MKGKRCVFKNPLTVFKVFPKRLTNGGIFNNRLLFFLLFSENCCGGDKALMERAKAVMGGFASPSH